MSPLWSVSKNVATYLRILENLISVATLIRAYLVEKNRLINSHSYTFIRDCRVLTYIQIGKMNTRKTNSARWSHEMSHVRNYMYLTFTCIEKYKRDKRLPEKRPLCQKIRYTLHFRKEKLSTNSSRDFSSVLDTINHY